MRQAQALSKPLAAAPHSPRSELALCTDTPSSLLCLTIWRPAGQDGALAQRQHTARLGRLQCSLHIAPAMHLFAE